MTNKLSQETFNNIKKLSKEVAGTHGLADEICDELASHMEDKLLGYLSGEEPLTEADAFVLVREHFGDTAVVKALFQEVHPKEVNLGFLRMVLAAFIATSLVTLVLGFFNYAVFLLLPHLRSLGLSDSTVYGLIWAHRIIVWALGVCGLWILLRHWRAQLDTEKRVWACHGNLALLVPVSVLLWWCSYKLNQRLVLFYFYQAADVFPRLTPSSSVVTWDRVTKAYILLLACVKCASWIWWCDRKPRSVGIFAKTALAWAVIYYLCEMGPRLSDSLLLLNSETKAFTLFVVFVAPAIKLFATGMLAYLGYRIIKRHTNKRLMERT